MLKRHIQNFVSQAVASVPALMAMDIYHQSLGKLSLLST